jgi:UDP-glucose 4-epimerase
LLNDYCIKKNAKVETFNLGTGTGSSVLVTSFCKMTRTTYKVSLQRGDITSGHANTDKANTVLDGAHLLEESMASAWKWEQQNSMIQKCLSPF